MVDVWCGECLVWWMSVWWMSYNPNFFLKMVPLPRNDKYEVWGRQPLTFDDLDSENNIRECLHCQDCEETHKESNISRKRQNLVDEIRMNNLSTCPFFSSSPLTEPGSVGAILFSALNCNWLVTLFSLVAGVYPIAIVGEFYPIAIVGEADGDDDKDKDRDDGDHHHVGGEQCCQVVWFSAEWKNS